MHGKAKVLETLILGVIVVYFTAATALLLPQFSVPHLDYFDFLAVAESFSAAELPVSFKRAPLYPALMALGALFAPGADPYLTAARWINVLATPVALILTYLFAKPALGRWSVWAVAWLASSAVFTLNGAQPVCEMFYSALILGTLVVTGRGGWPYLLGGLAALTRYEAVALVLLLGAFDFFAGRRRRAILFTALAVFPVALWVGVSLVKAGPVHPYLEQYLIYRPAPVEFLKAAASLLITARPPAAVALSFFGLALAIAGVFYAAKRVRSAYAVAAVFLVVYLVAHAVYPWPFRRFFLPVLAIAVFGLWYGVRCLVRKAFEWRPAAYAAGAVGFLSGAALAGTAIAYVGGMGGDHLAATAGPVLLLAGAAAYGVLLGPRVWYRLGAGLLVVALGAAYVSKSGAVARDDFYLEQWGTSYHLAAAFLNGRVGSQARVATTTPWLLEYHLEGQRTWIEALDGHLDARDCDELAAQLRRRRVKYLLVDSLTCDALEAYRRPCGDLIRPLYDRRAGPSFRLVKEIATRYEKLYIYEIDKTVPRGGK